jgi:hypothetical protein
MDAEFAAQRDEVRPGQCCLPDQTTSAFDECCYALVTTRPQRLDQPTTFDDLRDKWLTDLWRRSGNDDAIKRRLLRKSNRPVAHYHRDVADSGRVQILARVFGKIREPLDRNNLPAQTRQDRRLKAEPRADLEHTLIATQLERLNHEREK